MIYLILNNSDNNLFLIIIIFSYFQNHFLQNRTVENNMDYTDNAEVRLEKKLLKLKFIFLISVLGGRGIRSK